jgi:hypothetical protein
VYKPGQIQFINLYNVAYLVFLLPSSVHVLLGQGGATLGFVDVLVAPIKLPRRIMIPDEDAKLLNLRSEQFLVGEIAIWTFERAACTVGPLL